MYSKKSDFSQQRPNRFASLAKKRELAHETEKRRQEEKKEFEQKNKVQADYKTRGLDFCPFCGDKFNVGEKIPRILVHCGHTFCTECLSQLY
jgi:hypothetical protein